MTFPFSDTAKTATFTAPCPSCRDAAEWTTTTDFSRTPPGTPHHEVVCRCAG